MIKVFEENERMKRKYVFHLEEADGLDAKIYGGHIVHPYSEFDFNQQEIYD